MKLKSLSFILVLLLVLIPSCATPASPSVTRVIDGDTIEVSITGLIYKVRYIGIDTPELDDKDPAMRALAQNAVSYNRQLVGGKMIQLEKDVSETDRYGRLLRYVYTGEIFVNAELVRKGFAWAKAYPPDTRHQSYFEAIEKEAKEGRRGIWALSLSQLRSILKGSKILLSK